MNTRLTLGTLLMLVMMTLGSQAFAYGSRGQTTTVTTTTVTTTTTTSSSGRGHDKNRRHYPQRYDHRDRHARQQPKYHRPTQVRHVRTTVTPVRQAQKPTQVVVRF